MSYTYASADHKRPENAAAQKETDAPQLSMAAARFGAGTIPPSVPSRRVDLPGAMRAKMENAFGADLSAVRLYESQAVADAGANAVAQGSNIAFAPGMADFTSRKGQSLLGHELSHVVSQARGEVRGSGFLNDRALEARADREGAMAASGEQIAMPTAAMSGVSAAAAAGPMQADKMSYEEKFDPADRDKLKPTLKDRFDWRTEQMSWKRGPVGAMGKLGQRMLWGKQEEDNSPQSITVLPEPGPDGMSTGDPLTLLQFPEEKEKKQHWWNKLSRKKKDKNQIQDVIEGEENPYAPTDPDEIVRQKAAAWGMSEEDVRDGTVYEDGPNPYAPTDPMEIARQKAAAWDMSVEDVLAGKLPPDLQAKQSGGDMGSEGGMDPGMMQMMQQMQMMQMMQMQMQMMQMQQMGGMGMGGMGGMGAPITAGNIVDTPAGGEEESESGGDDIQDVIEGEENPYAPTDPMEIARQKAAAWDMSVEDVLAGKLPPELQAKQDADQIDSLAKTTDEFDADQIDDLAKTTDEFDADQIDDLAQTADEFDADLDKRR